MSLQDIEDAFVNITIDDQPRSAATATSQAASEPKTAYQHWTQHNAAQTNDDEVYMFRSLQKLYPGHHIITMQDYGGANAILQFPEVIAMPVDNEDQIIRASFISLPRASDIPGVVAREHVFAVYTLFWKSFEFKYVVTQYLYGFGPRRSHYFIHKGTKSAVDELIVAAGAFAEKLHNEIWVYDNSWWEKDAGLYAEVQRANWKDVILKQEFKDTIRNDIEGFYTQEKIYKDLGIPWKRGIIMYGPPGNGKTISMKAIMKSAPATPLYVRNFNHYGGPEMAMKVVFAKARQLAPSLLILEDLDALITSGTKSYFLNEVDGLDNNDGILIIGTTNYLERIDPALSKRPSRFDRKFLFDIPDTEERALYCKYWQHKLESNKDLDFPDSLVQSIAEATDKFSFAFLKEVFVNTLVQLATGSEKRPFAEAVLATAEKLRKEIGSEDLKQTMHGAVTRDGVPMGQEQQNGLQGPRFARALQTHFRSLMEP